MRRAPAQLPPKARKELPTRATRLPNPRFWGLAALSGGVYLFLWVYVDPGSWYYGSAPVFSSSAEFLWSRFRVPGGVLQRSAEFLGQLSYYPWLGAVVLLIMTGLLSLATGWLDAKAGGRPGILWALPAWLVLLLASGHIPGILELSGAVLLALGFLGLALTLPVRGFRRMGLMSFLLLALFYIGGPVPTLLLITAGGVFEMMDSNQASREGDRRGNATYWAWTVPWVVTLAVWTGLDPTGLSSRVGTGWTRVAAAGLMVFLPLAWFGRLLVTRVWPGNPIGRSAVDDAHHRAIFFARAIGGAAMLVLFAIGLQPQERALRRIQSEAEHGHWGSVLEAAGNLRKIPASARLQIQRALQHEGRLTSDLFSFPQRAGIDFLPSLADGLDVCLPLTDTFLELGHVNLAEHYAHEALEIRGERPAILWRLGWINLVKERPEAARIFLNRLARVPFQGARAAHWLRLLERDPTLAEEPSMKEARAQRVTSDTVGSRFLTQELLWQAVGSGRRNSAANDYLLAQILLARQPDTLLRNRELLALTPSAPFPRHLAEALLELSARKETQALVPQGQTFAPELIDSFNRFRQAIAERNTRSSRPSAALIRDFGDTYWFYEAFGYSGKSELASRQEGP